MKQWFCIIILNPKGSQLNASYPKLHLINKKGDSHNIMRFNGIILTNFKKYITLSTNTNIMFLLHKLRDNMHAKYLGKLTKGVPLHCSTNKLFET